MAISANAVWEIRTAGNDNNGGAFVTGAAGVDYSQQDSPRTGLGTDDSTTDAVANGTTTITSATANFTADIVGNVISLQGGTGTLTKTWRQVTARTNATTITVDASVAAGTGITMNIGGALASLGMAGHANAVVSGNIIWVKSGTYTISSASTNISGGCFNNNGRICYIFGYDATRGDFGTAPILNTGAISTFTVILNTGNVWNFTIDGNGSTSSRGLQISTGIAYKVNVEACTNGGIVGSLALAIGCRATGCSSQSAFLNIECHACVAENNTFSGFSGNVPKWINCISANNTGASSDGFVTSTSGAHISNCVAYGNGRDGFRVVSEALIVNCIAEDNTGVGYNAQNNTNQSWFNNAAFSNGTDFSLGTGKGSFNEGDITYTSTAFTNGGSNDFSLNSTAGGGADLKALAFPTPSFPGGTTDNFLDIGAAQSQGSAPPAGGETSAVF